MARVSSFKGLMLNRFDFERADVPEDMEGTNVGGALRVCWFQNLHH